MKQHAVRLFVVLALLCVGIMAFAQSDTARLIGTVTDPTGAAIQGATITVTNLGTNRTVTVTSNNSGDYVVNALPVGKYRVNVKQANFRTQTAEVALNISQVQEINFKLQVGGASDTVNVTDEVPLVETSTSSSGEIIQGRQVTELPLNGRNFTSLALLTPGVTRGAAYQQAMGGSSGGHSETWRNSENGGGALNVNGQRSQANNYIWDGVDNNDSFVNNLLFFPPTESIQEFRVNTSVAPAEFGRAGGAIVQVQTKTGTNAIHGTGFWFRRTDALDANPKYFTGGSTTDTFKRNQFGGTVGGAIWKDKIFGFVDYQGFRQNQPVNWGSTHVPTLKMRNGDFTELLVTDPTKSQTSVPVAAVCPNLWSGNSMILNGGNLGYVFNPQTCLPFGWVGDAATGAPGANINIIPALAQNAVGKNYLNAFPLPNIDNVNTAGNASNFQPNRSKTIKNNDFDGRLDFVLNQKETIFARYSYGQDNLAETVCLQDADHFLPSCDSSGSNPQHPRQVALGYTRVLASNLINEFRFGYSRPYYGYQQPGYGTPMAANLGIPNANTSSLLGGMALIGGWSGQLEYSGDYGPYVVKQKTFQFNDALSLTVGRHAFKFGVNVMHRGVDWTQANRAKGYFWIDDNNGTQWSGFPWAYSNHGTFTGYEVSELLAGFMSAYQIGVFNGYYNTNNWENGYFFQDDWRVNSKLTLNLGLRYDQFTWPTEANNRQSNFDPATGTLALPGDPGFNNALIETPKHNFGPRIGFAYDLFGNSKTVVRGGYGYFYFLDRGGVGVQLSNNPDFNGTQTYYACPTPTTCGTGYRITLGGAAPLGSLDPTVATGALPTATSGTDPKHLTTNDNVIYYPKNSPNSNIQQWNLQVEQAISKNTSVNVAYVGMSMGNLATSFQANGVQFGTASTRWFPGVGNINGYEFVGSGNYNALQMSMKRRMAQGLQYTLSYTWSHTLDNSSGALDGADNRILVGANGTPLLQYNYGNSNTDIRHSLVASALYELPFGKGKMFMSNAPKALDYVFGGWQWSNVLMLSSGAPFDVTMNNSGATGRPNYNGGCSVDASGLVWLSCPSGAFTAAASGTVGNLPRNYFHAPGLHRWDMTLSKDFAITERVKTRFLIQAFNVTNTPYFNSPDGNVSNSPDLNGHSGFGVKSSTITGSEREVEFGLRLSF